MASIKKIVLASQSPFRRQLLASTGLVFDVQVAPIDEQQITASTPRELAEARAAAKGMAVAKISPGCLVIGADQVLSLGDRAYDKAPDLATARQHLEELNGKTHTLHSAIVLAYGEAGDSARLLRHFTCAAAMAMRQLSSAEIGGYLETGEWRGSVGCYQFENRGIQLFEGTHADQSTVIGLPLQELMRHLRELGVAPLLQPAAPWTLAL